MSCETLLSAVALCRKRFNLTLNSFRETVKPLRSLPSSRNPSFCALSGLTSPSILSAKLRNPCDLCPPRETLLSTLCRKRFNLTLNSFRETVKPLRSLLSSRFRNTISPPSFQPTMMRSLPSSWFHNTISPFIFSTGDDAIS